MGIMSKKDYQKFDRVIGFGFFGWFMSMSLTFLCESYLFGAATILLMFAWGWYYATQNPLNR